MTPLVAMALAGLTAGLVHALLPLDRFSSWGERLLGVALDAFSSLLGGWWLVA